MSLLSPPELGRECLGPLWSGVRRGQNSTGLPLTVIQPMKVEAQCDVDKKNVGCVALSDAPSHSQEEPARVVVRSREEVTWSFS